jgi:predicted amidohydrolase
MRDSRDGLAWQVGLSVCYDLRFPELYRAAGQRADDAAGARAPSPTPRARRTGSCCCAPARWKTCAYVLAPAQGGQHENGRRTWGHSIAIGPWGEVLAVRPEGAGLVLADLDQNRQQVVRTQLPALTHRVLG